MNGLNRIYADASGVAHDTNSHDAGLRAVEAAVRADAQIVTDAWADAAKQWSHKAEQIEDELNAAVMRHGYAATVPAMRIAELLTAAIVSEDAPEQPEGAGQ